MKHGPKQTMTIRRSLVSLLAGAILLAGSASAQTPAPTDAPAVPSHLATIKLKLVMENMQETIDAQHQLEGLQKQLDAMTKSRQAEIKVLQDKAVSDPSLLTALERYTAVDALDRKTFEVSIEEQTLKLKIQRAASRQLVKSYLEINTAVKELATRRGYDVVLIDTGANLPPNAGDIANEQALANLVFQRSTLSVAEPVDISIEIITGLNKGYKSPPGVTPPPPLPTMSMQIGSKTFQLEIANDEPSREHGLMERNTLPADHGMIFVFSTATEQNFWMHHTRFPLDIVYVDAGGRVVSIKTMKPYDESPVPSNGEAKYAIELSGGLAATTGIKPGDTLKIPSAADAAMKK